MIDAKKVRELSKDLTVLYVEDEIAVQKELESMFKIFFKNVIVANDGQEGLELYAKYQKEIDMIISDIRMPRLDGLAMVEQIRKKNRDIPIIMLTAFNEQEYFIKSISLKIDKYMLKPIDQVNFLNTIYDVGNNIKRNRLLEEFIKENQEAELRDREQKTMRKFTEAYSFPMVIFSPLKLLYYSKAFATIFSSINKHVFDNLTLESEGIFESERGFLKSFRAYNDKNIEFNKVKVTINGNKKVFRVHKKDIDYDGDSAQMFVLIDITYEEYLREQNYNYTQSLEKMVVEKKVSNTTSISTDDESEKKIKDMPIKKRYNKISAKEFIQTINPSFITDVLDIDDFDKKIYSAILKFEEGLYEELKNVAEQLSRFADTMYFLDDFTDIQVVIRHLADILHSVDFGELPIDKHNAFIKHINSIREDLSEWRKTIFIDENAHDIHYLDSSIFSSCLQLEALISSIDEDTIENYTNLDFF